MIWRSGVSLLKGGAFIFYAVLKLLPVQEKLVLISRLNKKSSLDFQLLVDQMKKDYPETKIVVLNHKMTRPTSHVFDIIQEMYHLATSKACIVESYVISVSILNHRPSLRIIQMWHALGAVKAFGHMSIDKAEGSSKEVAELMNMHKKYTYAVAGSSETALIFAKAFNMPAEKILPIGMPRVDYLLDEEVQKENRANVRNFYGISDDKKLVLYAPTFRKGSKMAYSKIIDAFENEGVSLLIKQHPHDKSRITPTSGIIVDSHFNLLQLLAASDVVITDYSATVFEAALLKKPLFFWLFDKDKYDKRRGFAMDINSLPGLKTTSISEIVTAINDNNYVSTAEITKFADKYVEFQDGTSTEKILRLALEASS